MNQTLNSLIPNSGRKLKVRDQVFLDEVLSEKTLMLSVTIGSVFNTISN